MAEELKLMGDEKRPTPRVAAERLRQRVIQHPDTELEVLLEWYEKMNREFDDMLLAYIRLRDVARTTQRELTRFRELIGKLD